MGGVVARFPGGMEAAPRGRGDWAAALKALDAYPKVNEVRRALSRAPPRASGFQREAPPRSSPPP